MVSHILSLIPLSLLKLIQLEDMAGTMKFLAKELQKLCKSLMLLFFQSLLSSA
uniref:Serine/threonine-protein kinase WNK1-like n=1 Tax=Rhizophora mucronata TaxID=61149 RepID=A0A2P2KP65_RHIMU